jgi:hypothetical protein
MVSLPFCCIQDHLKAECVQEHVLKVLKGHSMPLWERSVMGAV